MTITPGTEGETLTLSCKRPIKGIILDIEDRSTDEQDGECRWSDQAIDLMPGDDQVVVVKGLKGRKVKARVSWRFELLGYSLTLTDLQYLGDGTA